MDKATSARPTQNKKPVSSRMSVIPIKADAKTKKTVIIILIMFAKSTMLH